jgi:murein DD-endopeptidase MepM/ murein hydrolase activator NlpD
VTSGRLVEKRGRRPRHRWRWFRLPALLAVLATTAPAGVSAFEPGRTSPRPDAEVGAGTVEDGGSGIELAVIRDRSGRRTAVAMVASRHEGGSSVSPSSLGGAAHVEGHRPPVVPGTNAFPVPAPHAAAFSDDWHACRDGCHRRHEGTDVFAAEGTPIVAVESGLVARVDGTDDSNGGLSVWLVGDSGVAYWYAHNATNEVTAGQRVGRAEMIGRVGHTGNARTTPSHIHFQVNRCGELSSSEPCTVNPYDLLRRWRREPTPDGAAGLGLYLLSQAGADRAGEGSSVPPPVIADPTPEAPTPAAAGVAEGDGRVPSDAMEGPSVPPLPVSVAGTRAPDSPCGPGMRSDRARPDDTGDRNPTTELGAASSLPATSATPTAPRSGSPTPTLSTSTLTGTHEPPSLASGVDPLDGGCARTRACRADPEPPSGADQRKRHRRGFPEAQREVPFPSGLEDGEAGPPHADRAPGATDELCGRGAGPGAGAPTATHALQEQDAPDGSPRMHRRLQGGPPRHSLTS